MWHTSVLGVICPPYEDVVAGCLSSESDRSEGLKLGLLNFKGEDKTNKQQTTQCIFASTWKMLQWRVIGR